jgi:hypothetical protein
MHKTWGIRHCNELLHFPRGKSILFERVDEAICGPIPLRCRETSNLGHMINMMMELYRIIPMHPPPTNWVIVAQVCTSFTMRLLKGHMRL